MLALIPWVASHDGPSVDEVCQRFAITRDELISDLNVVFMVGTYPYTPDQLIEAIIEDDRVWIRYADMFARPLRLTPEEALALVAAGEAILAMPGADLDGVLARGLAKVAKVLDIEPGEAIDVDFGAVPKAVFEQLREAVGAHRAVRLDYYSFGRDERSQRVVEPWSLWTFEGNWYLRGNCRSAGGERIFRLDRIAEVETLSETFEPPADIGEPAAVLEGDLEEVTLVLEPEARWVAETNATTAQEELPNGRLRATFQVASRAWLTRLLLQLGPQAQLLGHDTETRPHRELAADAARRLLARYAS
jgi:proteasome accessory factor C